MRELVIWMAFSSDDENLKFFAKYGGNLEILLSGFGGN